MRKTYTSTAIALTFAATVQPALALGSVDPAAAANNFGSWLFVIATAFIPMIAIYKGVHAMMNGEHFGRHVASFIGGLILCVGGATAISHFG